MQNKHIRGLRAAARRGGVCLLAFIALLILPTLALAAPSNQEVWTFHQPDGTPFQAKVIGDEHFAFYETPGGNVIEQDAKSRYWHYARPKADGTLERTGIEVGQPAPKTMLNQEKGAWLSVMAEVAAKKAEAAMQPDSAVQRAPASGTVRGVLLLANFSDTTLTFSTTDIYNLCNTVGYNSNGALGSVRDFYYENSYGAFTIEMDVFACTLPQTRAFYGQNSGPTLDINRKTMISDAIAAADATTAVNFADYDADGDGWVDVFGVAHQGQGEEAGGGTNAIWSHCGNLVSTVTIDGKKIRNYFTAPERYGASSLATIGVYCHEMAHHMFNLPDLYDLDGGSNGIGNWSLMSHGMWLGPNGAKPCHLDPWCKMVLGWLSPTPVLSTQTGLALPSFDQNASALLVPVDPYQDGEYFLVSNRYKRTTAAASTGFDQYLPGSGALILHVDDYVKDNRVETLKKIDVEEADGASHLDNQANLGDSSDLYPNGASAFSNTSSPNTKANDGSSTGIVVDTFAGAGTANMTCSVAPLASPVGSYIGYDSMGTSGAFYGYDGIDYGVVRFTTNSAATLERIKTHFTYFGTTNFTVYVYSAWSGGTPSGLLTSQSGSHAGGGFREITLTSPQAFAASTDFYVQVKYDSGYFFPYVFPIESDWHCSERSWVSNDGVTYTQMTVANNLPYDLNIRADLSTALSADPITPITPSPTNSTTIDFSVHFSADVVNFNNAADLVITEGGSVAHTGASISGGLQDYTVSITGVSGNGTMALAVDTTSDVQDASASPLTFSVTSAFVTVDNTSPTAPSVGGATPTNDTTPAWSWTPGGGGNGSYRYQLDSEAGAWTNTTSTSYAPAAPLTEATHTLYVQERDDAGNWSASGSFAITIDVTPPNAPNVGGDASPTNDATPGWSWASGGGGGNGTFRYKLDAGGWTETSSTAFTPVSGLGEGSHRLTVQERDAAGNWSVDSFFDIYVDITLPVITRIGNAEVTVERYSTYIDAGATANDNYDGNLTASIETITLVGTSLIGDYPITYDVFDSAGNAAVRVTRTVHVVDTVPPAATLITPITPSPTMDGTIAFRVTFSEVVSNFNNAADLVVSKTGSLAYTGVIITDSAYVNIKHEYTVELTGVTGVGAVSLAVSTSSDVRDGSANSLISSVTSVPVLHTNPPGPVWVDFAYGGSEQGTEMNPFNTVAEGVAAANPGATLVAAPGATSETIRITKQVRIEADGGHVYLGSAGGP